VCPAGAAESFAYRLPDKTSLNPRRFKTWGSSGTDKPPRKLFLIDLKITFLPLLLILSPYFDFALCNFDEYRYENIFRGHTFSSTFKKTILSVFLSPLSKLSRCKCINLSKCQDLELMPLGKISQGSKRLADCRKGLCQGGRIGYPPLK
jgi:hypothetical protein